MANASAVLPPSILLTQYKLTPIQPNTPTPRSLCPRTPYSNLNHEEHRRTTAQNHRNRGGTRRPASRSKSQPPRPRSPPSPLPPALSHSFSIYPRPSAAAPLSTSSHSHELPYDPPDSGGGRGRSAGKSRVVRGEDLRPETHYFRQGNVFRDSDEAEEEEAGAPNSRRVPRD